MQRLMPLLAFSALVAQQATLRVPEQRQFDFWLGDWEVSDPSGRVVGHNRIEAILGGKVIQEHWRGAKGSSGTSLNAYLPGRRAWHQTWVDDQGEVLELSGGLVGASMVLEGRTPTGQGDRRERISWTPLPDGRVRQHWEQSLDGGRTWTTAFEGVYRRLETGVSGAAPRP